MGPRDVLDAVVKRKIRSPYRDSNPISSGPYPSFNSCINDTVSVVSDMNSTCHPATNLRIFSFEIRNHKATFLFLQKNCHKRYATGNRKVVGGGSDSSAVKGHVFYLWLQNNLDMTRKPSQISKVSI